MNREEIQKQLAQFETYLLADDHTKEMMTGLCAMFYHKGKIDGIEEGAAIWRPSHLSTQS